MGQTRSLSGLFSSFARYNDKYRTINRKSVDGVHGIRTRGGRMEGADESTELWQLHSSLRFCSSTFLCLVVDVGWLVMPCHFFLVFKKEKKNFQLSKKKNLLDLRPEKR